MIFSSKRKALGLRVSPRHTLGELERYRKSLGHPKRRIDSNQSSQPCLGVPKEIGKIPNPHKYGMVAGRLTSTLGSSSDKSIRDIFWLHRKQGIPMCFTNIPSPYVKKKKL